jgi:hypothetical protein
MHKDSNIHIQKLRLKKVKVPYAQKNQKLNHV